jgi:GNAT superfamily N-acetyltransferase
MKTEDRTPPLFRSIRLEELPQLLALYRHLHPDDPELSPTPELDAHWQQITDNPLLHYFVADHAGQLVSTCTLTVIPNLTRAARPYGLIENVVTHPDFRKRGLATSLLKLALSTAWDHGCYKVMLLTSRQDEATLRFYQKAGFETGSKTAFIAKP